MLPYVIINVAMSLNGKISSISGRYKISGKDDMQRVYGLRRSVDAVLIGANTVMIDNPVLSGSLNRIILDGNFKLSENYKIFDGKINTYIFSLKEKFIENAKTVVIDNTDIHGILESIYRLGMKKILVEGGSQVISQFLKANIFNEFYIYINPGLLLSGTSLFPDVDANMEYKIIESGQGLLLGIKRIDMP
jgi:2,5-diamino-6-(ribosylamino)-4(3H)-pyrimidinone 5'-phosphate reductase